ncbi:CHAT domain-containing protein [Streptomyces griseorubiginosus]|uniref:CHAT domain-containing protein n=1 Tax=Streptomyces griseorubiginosus TaxID=67304 RepID=UPI0036366765
MAERQGIDRDRNALLARAREVLALADPAAPDLLEEAIWLHDELENPPTDRPVDVAVALRRWILSRLATAGTAASVGHGLRQQVFAEGVLDIEAGPLRRMWVWEYLGTARFIAFGGSDRALLDEAVAAFRSSLAAAHDLPPAGRAAVADHLDQVRCHLAGILGMRYNQDREVMLLPGREQQLRWAEVRADLTEAIALTEQVARRPCDSGATRPLPPEWAGVRAHLLTYRWQDTPVEQRRGADIDEALRLLEGLPPPTADAGSVLTWWGSRSLLANALIARGGPEDLRRAEQLVTEVLDRPETADPLVRAGFLQTLASARMLRAESDRGDSAAAAAAARAYDEAYKAGLQGNLRASWDAATQHAGWLRHRGRRRDSARRYGEAFRVLPALTRLQRDRSQKEQVLAQAADVSADCVRELALSADPDDRADAVVVLESARAVLLSEALTPLGSAPGEDDTDALRLARLAGELDRQRRAAMSSAPTGDPVRAEFTHREYAFLAERMRRRDGIARSLPAAWPDVCSAADSTALVFLVAAADGGAALIVPAGAQAHDAPIGVDLPDLDRQTVRNLLVLLGEADILRPGERSPRTGETRGRLARRLVEQLWHCAMRPVASELRDCGRAVLLPGGLLGMLPLHAAGVCAAPRVDDWWFLMEETVLSYAPSVGVLTAARQAAASAPALLLATEPPLSDSPVGRPDARVELDAVRKLTRVRPWLLSGQEATPERLLRALDECDVLHFAGHAQSLPDTPLESGLGCAGGRLSVRDLLARGPGRARAALLCACSTARVGTGLPDEAIGLPTALLQAGFGSVVSTQWTVFDNITGPLLKQLYERWDAGQDLAAALTGAQRALLRGRGGPVMANPWDWGAFVHTGA